MDLLARQTADYLERKHAEKIQKTLIGEIQHRSNNLLAIIQPSRIGPFQVSAHRVRRERRLKRDYKPWPVPIRS